MSEEELPTARIIDPGQNVVPTYLPGIGNVGQRKTLMGIGWKEWVFLLVSLLNLLATIGLTIYRLVVVTEDHKTSSSDFTFAILILVNSLFCIFYVLNGVLSEEVYQIYVFIVAVSIIVLYCVIEYIVDENRRTEIKLIRLILVSVLAPVNIVFAILVIKEFGWLEFRIVGASDLLQHMYRQTNRFFSLLLLDMEIAISVGVLVLKNGSDVSLFEIVILAVGIPIFIIQVFWGWFTVTRELKPGVVIFVIIALFEPGYVIYKLVDIYLDVSNYVYKDLDTNYILYTEIAACALALLLRAILYYEFYRVVSNFGKGLKERGFSFARSTRIFNSELSERSGLLSSAQGRWQTRSYNSAQALNTPQ